MKILAIRGANIASLTEFDIDFQGEPLRSAGIFAITGPTGAGKSSLLDAMCLALYQRAPRLDDLSGRETKVESRFGEIGQADIRNLLRRGSDTGYAECDFRGGDGRSYRARWGYRAAKRKGAAVQEEMSLVRLDDGQVLVGSSNRKGEFQGQILSLLGLTYNQFMRTVLLAQGRFAEFLRSNEDDRADLLEKLTGTEVYGRISKRIYERTAQVQDQVASLERDREGLALLDPEERDRRTLRLGELEADLPRAETRRDEMHRFLEAIGRLETLRRTRAELSREREATRSKREAAARELAEAKARWDLAEQRTLQAQPRIAEARELDAALEAARGVQAQRVQALAEATRVFDQVEARYRELCASRDEVAQTIGQDREWLEGKRVKLEPLAENWGLWQEKLRQADHHRAEEAEAEVSRAASEAVLQQAMARCDAVAGDLSRSNLDEGLGVEELHESLAEISKRRGILQAALPILQARAELEVGEQELSEREREMPGLESRARELEASWTAAKRVLDETRSALSGDVEHLRAGLRNGTPCPVCGSAEHPWATALPALNALVERQAQAEEVARTACESSRQDRDRAVAQLEAHKRVLLPLRKKVGSAQLDESLSRELQGPGDAVDRVQDRLVELAGRERVAMDRLASLRKQDEVRAAMAEARSKQELARAALDRDATRLETAQAALEACLALLDKPFGSAAWRTRWRENPAFGKETTKYVEEFVARRESLDRNLRREEPLAAAIATQAEVVASRQAEVAACRAESDRSREAAEVLHARRRSVLEGRAVSEVVASLELELRTARDRHDEVRGVHDRAAMEAASLEGRAIEAERQERAETEELRHRGEALDIGTDDLADPVGWAEHARRKTADMEAAIAAARSESAELAIGLSRDAENRDRVGEIGRKLSVLRETHSQWSLLCDQIGSADGKKFKRIAQQFTLEILLEEANAQLVTVAPRYSLRMLGNSMHFGVLDHESYGELRPVQTLSGGESFLVSLGLALGLSRMAGGELSVESLFIDEGFGTLDAETLRCVMVALSNLHAQGRKVGLITHVEEMKEQIPVRIEVVKLGQGTSRVEVRG